MEEEDEEEDLGWKEEFAPCRSRKLPCYTIGGKTFRKNSVFQMYSPHSFSQGIWECWNMVSTITNWKTR